MPSEINPEIESTKKNCSFKFLILYFHFHYHLEDILTRVHFDRPVDGIVILNKPNAAVRRIFNGWSVGRFLVHLLLITFPTSLYDCTSFDMDLILIKKKLKKILSLVLLLYAASSDE